MVYTPSILPLSFDLETKLVLKKLAAARSALAELKGVTGIIPNMEKLNIQRKAAVKYLDEMVKVSLISKHKIGKENYYLEPVFRVRKICTILQRGN